MKSLLSILLILSLSSMSGQSPVIEWQKCLGGTGSERAYSIQLTSDGGYVIAGYSESNDGDVSGNHGFIDYWVVKLDSDGDLNWQRSLGGTGDDWAISIQQTSDGGYIVAGYSESNDGDVSGNHGNDYWVVKLDTDGNLIWQKCLGGTGLDFAESIELTSDGGFIVAGYSNSIDGDVTGNHGSFDYWIVKLDADGNLTWQKCLGGTSHDYASCIQQTSDGGYVVAGSSQSIDGDVTGNHGDYDYWIVKLDFDGDLIWQRSLGGTEAEGGLSIQQTSDGGYVITGFTESNDGDVTGNHGLGDYWIVKLDSDGDLVWQKSIGGTESERAYSLQETSEGSYVITGWSESNDGDVTGNHGGEDYWVVKLDSDGDLVWQKCLGGSAGDLAYSIQLTSDEGYVVAGRSLSNDGDVSGNHGFTDYWVVKLSPVVGIEEIGHNLFSIYPNPVSDKFTLSTDPEAIGRSYSIADQLGQVILEGKITSQSMNFDVTSFPRGTYYLSLHNQQGSIEIVKQ